MKYFLILIAIIIILNRITVINKYVNEYHGWSNNFGHWLGTFLASLTEGICWWYIIKNLI